MIFKKTKTTGTGKPTGLLSRFSSMLHDSTNYFIVILLASILTIWMISGNPPVPDRVVTDGRTNANMKNVLVETFAQQQTERTIQISGYTQEERKVEIKAELSAKVVTIAAKENDRVNKNTRLITLEQDRTNARLQQAKAQEKQTRIELESEQKLRSQGMSSAAAEARAAANYEAAKAARIVAQRDYDATVIVAPFNGRVEAIYVEEGDYVQPGQLVAQVVDYQPMLVIGSLSELEVAYINQGTQASISLITGETLSGVVRHITTQADPQTRTFEVEIEVPNDANNLRAGITAEINFHAGDVMATRIRPSLLSLDEQGKLGIKTVQDNRVLFTPVEVVKAETNEMWVTGIAAGTQVIVRGQGFVEVGEEVTTTINSG